MKDFWWKHFVNTMDLIRYGHILIEKCELDVVLGNRLHGFQPSSFGGGHGACTHARCHLVGHDVHTLWIAVIHKPEGAHAIPVRPLYLAAAVVVGNPSVISMGVADEKMNPDFHSNLAIQNSCLYASLLMKSPR